MLELLDAPELNERSTACDDILGNLEITIGSGEERERWHEVVVDLGKIAILEAYTDAVQRVETIMAATRNFEEDRGRPRRSRQFTTVRRAEPRPDRDSRP